MATKSEIQAAREYRARRGGPVDPTLRLLVEFTDSESQAAVKLSKAKGWRGYRVAGARLATGKALNDHNPEAIGFTTSAFGSGKLPVHTLSTGEAVASLPASAGARVFASPRDLEGAEVVIWWLIEEDLERVRSARMVGWLTAIEIQERPLQAVTNNEEQRHLNRCEPTTLLLGGVVGNHPGLPEDPARQRA